MPNNVPLLDISGTISDLTPKKISLASLAIRVRFGQQPVKLMTFTCNSQLGIQWMTLADMEKNEDHIMIPHYFEAGRPLLAKLPHGSDLIPTLEQFSIVEKIQTAVFFMIGAVSCVTLGHYDQKLQVYVTAKKEEPLEIAHCTGNITLRNEKPTIHMHAVLSSQDGSVYAGHIFSETIIFAGEIYIQPLLGSSLEREYDKNTGLFLWKGGIPWQKR